jgi:hypothetical protein
MPIKTLTTTITIKRVLYSLLALILLLLIWAGFALFYDESPDVGRDAFYSISANQTPDNQNLAIAISGINAPEGKDSIKHGRFLIDASKNDLTREAATFFANGPIKLEFIGKRDELECWLDGKLEKTASNCASVERLKVLILTNKTLLSRYQQLYTMSHWQGNTFGGGQTIINLNVLLAAEIKLDVDEGRQELAYQKWHDNFQFVSRALATQSTMIERAIFLVADGFCLSSLEYLLTNSPETSTKHYAELQALLKPNVLNRYNLKGMLRADYVLIDNEFMTKQQHIYYVHPNFIRNRIYRMQIKFLEGAHKPPNTFSSSNEQFIKKYKETQSIFDINWLDPFNSFLANKITGGLPRGLELIKSMHHHNGTINALNLITQIRVKNIDSADVQNYINLTGAEFNNPYTGKPMQWDAEKKAIIFTNPLRQESIEFAL